MPDGPERIDCLTAVRQLWDYLDEELDDACFAAVKHHLEVCQSCLPHRDFGHQFLEALQAVRHERPMPSEVRRKVMERLAAAGYGT